MKNLFVIVGIAIALIVTAVYAQNDSQPPSKWEYAMIKYDGPDKVQFIRPGKFEFIRLFQTGVKLPKDAHDEEFCVMTAANQMAAEGWEVVNLDATRLMLRRAK